jgi:hypothetical protein
MTPVNDSLPAVKRKQDDAHKTVAFFTCKTGQSKVKRRLFCFASE